jgi:NhaP-type Na+/H+ or K+/H+ antiporter
VDVDAAGGRRRAHRLRAPTQLPYPSLLALGGAAIALLPNGPEFTLHPELALAVFVAPVLLDAAFDTSLRDLRRYWIPVLSLVVVAVGVTTFAVAWIAHSLVPGMPWAAAIALGAIVAPPDAAAASAILRQLHIPHRMVVILEGESLLNDATALLIYRLAVSVDDGQHVQHERGRMAGARHDRQRVRRFPARAFLYPRRRTCDRHPERHHHAIRRRLRRVDTRR